MATRRTQANAQAPQPATASRAGRMVDTSHVGKRIARERLRDPELRAYLEAAGAHPLLSAAEEKQLAERVELGDIQARDRLIACNVRLVIPIAACYTDRGMSLIELIGYGNIGLCEAADSYDYRRGRFTTHATWAIRNAVSRSLANLGDTIRIARTTVELHKRLQAIEASEGEMTDREAAKRLHSTTQAVRRARACREAPISLDVRVTGAAAKSDVNAFTLADTIPDPAPEPEEAALAALDTPAMRAALAKSLATLAPRDRAIVALRFADGLSYPEIGERLGTGREAVRTAVNRILATLRAGIEDGGNTRITQANTGRRRIAG